jgi:alpha-tubulin suppressor-like RCC1 family protein
VLALTYNVEVYYRGFVCPELQLGYGDSPSVIKGVTVGRRPSPRRIEGLRDVLVRSVAPGICHGCAVMQAGEVYTWGRAEYVCLGHGEFADEPQPKRVEQLREDGVVVVGVSAGSTHTLVVGNDGRVYGVGTLRAIGTTDILDHLDEESDGGLSDPTPLGICAAGWQPTACWQQWVQSFNTKLNGR